MHLGCWQAPASAPGCGHLQGLQVWQVEDLVPQRGDKKKETRKKGGKRGEREKKKKDRRGAREMKGWMEMRRTR